MPILTVKTPVKNPPIKGQFRASHCSWLRVVDEQVWKKEMESGENQVDGAGKTKRWQLSAKA